MANLLELQDLLKGAAMADVQRVAQGSHPTVHEAWMGVDEIKRRVKNIEAEKAKKAEEGIQDPPMVDQYLAAAQQLEGPRPPVAQSPMAQPPMAQMAMGPPQAGQPAMGPPTGMQPGRMAELGQLSEMAQTAQTAQRPRRPMPARQQPRQGIRQLAASGGLIRGYSGKDGSLVGGMNDDLRRAMESIRHLPPAERAAAEKEISRRFGLDLDTRQFIPDAPISEEQGGERRPAGLYSSDTIRDGVRTPGKGTPLADDVSPAGASDYGTHNWIRGDSRYETFPGVKGIAEQLSTPFRETGSAIWDWLKPEVDYESAYSSATYPGQKTDSVPSQTPGTQDTPPGAPGAPGAPKTPPAKGEPEDRIYSLQEMIRRSIQPETEEEAAKRKKYNFGESLAMAGATALAGDSQHASVNIGKGGMAGLSNYARSTDRDEALKNRALDRAIQLTAALAGETGYMTFQEWQRHTWPQLAKQMNVALETMKMTPEQESELQWSLYSLTFGPMRKEQSKNQISYADLGAGLRGGSKSSGQSGD